MRGISSVLGESLCVGCRRLGGPLCESCRLGISSAGVVELPGLARVGAVWRHEGAARELVLGLKLRGRRAFAEPLVDAMVRLVRRSGSEASVVVWPPCSRSDRRVRGFDHAEVLARGVARELGLPARPLLRRVGVVSDQASLPGAERRRNVTGAFEAIPSPASVLLVDDVVTTGATLRACGGALRRAGASRVEAIVACSAFS